MAWSSRAPLARLLLALSTLSGACGGEAARGEEPDAGGGIDAGQPGVDAAPDDPTQALYQPDHVLEVEITMAPTDFALLRAEPEIIGMPKTTCAEQPSDKPYTYFPAEIAIDGVVVSDVGVRKKGSFGSLSTARPGLKISANEYISGQRIMGKKRVTLNNNHQDSSLISQCLGYGLFRQAGVPAPRCSFAHVTVNGEDLGVYSNVESIKKDFLERHFDDGSGRLYESGGDFVDQRIDGFQPKVDRDAPDCSDLSGVATALEAQGTEFVGALDAVLDIDAFTTYWAMEVVTNHWDGYANNRNNFFIYHDPTSDKFHFIPWGIDALFGVKDRTTRPQSVFACGSLAWRLYDTPGSRDVYLARLRELLTTIWDEDAILAEVTRMQALLEPIADPTGSGELAQHIDDVREFVIARGQVLLAELDNGTPLWPYPAGEESCMVNVGSVSATFDTTWDTLSNYGVGSGSMDGTVSDVSLTSSDAHANAGLSDSRAILQVFATLSDGRIGVVQVLVHDSTKFVPGTMDIDLINVAAIMSFYDPETNTASGGGLILGGSVTLESASTETGAPIVGSMNGDVFEF